ncbi:MAG: DUF1549 domain-containing protein [Planctomycetaceae bacterium]
MKSFHVLLLSLALGWNASTALAQRPGAKKATGGGRPASTLASAKPPVSRLPQSVRTRQAVAMEVAPVIASRRDDAAATAYELDQLIEAKLASVGQQPNAMTSDEVFLRRVYLQVAGRIPTLDEAQAFLDSKDPNRRLDLIDELLSSPDYVSNMYNMWADTLRLVQNPQPNIVAEPYLAYVKDAIRENKQYDQWVYEMLTADGKMWENPAVGFQLRDEGMPLPYVDNTVRVFLGTQIGCAQCHDHPFDHWTQHQFYQLAAYTAGTRTKNGGTTKMGMAGGKPRSLLKEAEAKYPSGKIPGALRRVVQANTYNVSEVKAALRLPHDYAYDDAKPKDLVQPKVLWGEVPSSTKNGTPREQFAAWLTSSHNERFKHTIVNRLWKRFLGAGFIDPIDDLKDDSVCVNEPAMKFLAAVLVQNDFNLKELIRSILYSKTFQREASDYQVTSGELYYFPGPIVQRMSAEQVWDSILTLAVHNPWPFQRPTAEEIGPNLDLDLSTASLETLEAVTQKYQATYFSSAYNKSLQPHSYQGNILCRASELPSPLPAGHFLRQFGQGDRQSIDGQNSTATVPQILAMLNGPITHVMLETGSAIYDNVVSAETTKDVIDLIFISVLTRRPTADDRRIAISEKARAERPGMAYGNVIWALLNTKEFLFIQ